MMTIQQIKKALKNKVTLVWNDPDPIKGNDYTINFIEDLSEHDNDSPILIQYGGGSEAEVLASEITTL